MSQTVSSSFPLPTVLFIVFLVLKLYGVIAWSWWWVTAPLWMPIGIVLAFVLFCLTMAVVSKLL